ncbi:flavodoxin family protein [Fusibacter paucivorans]|uniref:Flavodoxin family protein n=1 Tax=Fusibacter paucivorans TaxID=76009 RepID=A0ABS5PLG6_9FIRM|nr:flavodoxin family protein [Fusibacter paucivorans]MBS7525911.1 flavodoxin family protein [Fusibacter paucivorans]
MKILLLMGSMRQNGRTAEVTKAFEAMLTDRNASVEYLPLVKYDIKACTGCATCQNVLNAHGCVIRDDVPDIFEKVQSADAVFFTTPIYSWYCTTPVKSLMDRLVYMMNKYYGETRGGSFWAGKKLGIITTCGYPDHYGADLFETGIKRYAKHSDLVYIGHYNARDKGKQYAFFTEDDKARLTKFAEETVSALTNG